VGAAEDFWSAVRRLPRRQAEVVALRCLEEATDAEIAEILGCSEATVRVHAHHARRALAKALGADEEER
jgi:RNA polymerase sigma factor (sigma-70 family)